MSENHRNVSERSLEEVSVLNIAAHARFAFGQYVYTSGTRYGPLTGRQLEIIHLRTGRVRARFDNESIDLAAPRFALLACTDRLEYRYEAEESCHVAWCQCDSAALDDTLVSRLRPFCGPLPASDLALALMAAGLEEDDLAAERWPARVNSLAVALIQDFIAGKAAGAARGVSEAVERVRVHIDGHLAEPISSADLSRVSGLTPQHLNRLFSAAYGRNPLDYLWHQRTRQGAFLLRHTGLRISSIAYEVGFRTPNHFARHIRRQFGISPRDLRRQHWAAEPRSRVTPEDSETEIRGASRIRHGTALLPE